jgi:protein TonB
MQCPHCHNAVSASDAFCRHCGGNFGRQLRFTPISPGEQPPREKSPPRGQLFTLLVILGVIAAAYWSYERLFRTNTTPEPAAAVAAVTSPQGPPSASVPSPAPAPPAATPLPTAAPAAAASGIPPDRIEAGFEAPETPGRRPAKTAVSGIPDAPPEPPPPPDSPVRVGGNVRVPVKVRDVRPVYPSIATAARVQGVVIAEVTIAADGSVASARVIRSIPLLDQAALDAIKQWQYVPTLINGVPAPVIATVTVQFTLGQ